MSEALAYPAPEPSEPLRWQASCQWHPDPSVALVDIDWVDEDEVRAARIVGLGPRHADPRAQARHLHSRSEEVDYSFTWLDLEPRRGFFTTACGL